ncbi:hypothetical protein F8388_018731 [Cannabis sativa]|uniref:Helicase ATP-binding domain-containing protein n=1 Tax=Cannabis sativa TaxID=3483 RepID=A0A7J6GPF9_CANSA|nr:hypothetical protein F8388_018731 [Cannabis sativa]
MIYTAIDTFYLTHDQLQNSPSRKDNIDEPTETTLRIYGCDLIQESGILLILPQAVMATAQVLFHINDGGLCNNRFESFRTLEMGVPKSESAEVRLAWLRSQIIGGNYEVEYKSPFGKRTIVYADHTASGRSLLYIENFIINNVLPFYDSKVFPSSQEFYVWSNLRCRLLRLRRRLLRSATILSAPVNVEKCRCEILLVITMAFTWFRLSDSSQQFICRWVSFRAGCAGAVQSMGPVHFDFEIYGGAVGLTACSIYGGSAFRSQELQLRRGVDIVIGTPGRVKDHLERKNLDLTSLKFRVLDEADEMLKMGFVDDVELILVNASMVNPEASTPIYSLRGLDNFKFFSLSSYWYWLLFLIAVLDYLCRTLHLNISCSFHPICLTLWGALVQDISEKLSEVTGNNSIIMGTKMIVQTKRGLSLSSRESSTIEIDPDNYEATTLHQWA